MGVMLRYSTFYSLMVLITNIIGSGKFMDAEQKETERRLAVLREIDIILKRQLSINSELTNLWEQLQTDIDNEQINNKMQELREEGKELLDKSIKLEQKM